ncbi:MAG: hypothetical protein ACUVXI_09545 [bacterium]
MRKRIIILFVVLSLFVLFGYAVLSAEVWGDLKCGDCHSSTPKYPILGARAGYDHSGHKNGGNSYYANGAGCQRCHTNEGFIEYVSTGKVDPEAYVEYPSQPGCFTCHSPHETGDLSLRTTAAVTLANGKTFDRGEGNLCANCHQARVNATEAVKAMPADKISPYWGAHHGPQADMIAGTNAYEFPGKSYSSSAHSMVVEDGCVDCHMSLPKGRYGLSPDVGGHSFNIKGEVHEVETLNASGCIACHKDIKQVAGKDIFDKMADADYDNDGTVEPLQAEVGGLLEKFVNDKGTGYLQKLTPPMYKADGSWNVAKTGERSKEEVAALYNYKFVLEDRSKGVHNAKYAIQILYDSLKALDPNFDASKRPR